MGFLFDPPPPGTTIARRLAVVYSRVMEDDVQTAPPRTLDTHRLDRAAGFLVRLAQLRIHDAFNAQLSPLGMTPARYSVLALVHDNPGIRPGQLAAALCIKPPNMAALLAQLEREGFVERSLNPAERRSALLRLTEAGTALFARMLPTVELLEAQSVAMLTAGERRRLLLLLTRVAAG